MLSMIDGDVFYPLRAWPKWIRLLFWSKPLTDKGTFQLTLFLIGNGCPPEFIMKWVFSSQYWAKDKKIAIEKRRKQVEWILANKETKGNYWFYFDLHYNMYVSLTGFERKRQ